MIIHTAALNTTSIGIYKNGAASPVLTISLANEDYKRNDYSEFFAPDDEITVKVASGSCNKPGVRVWIQTET